MFSSVHRRVLLPAEIGWVMFNLLLANIDKKVSLTKEEKLLCASCFTHKKIRNKQYLLHIPVERVLASSETLREMKADVTEKIYNHPGHTINEDELNHANHILQVSF